jgi:hypothetical protein
MSFLKKALGVAGNFVPVLGVINKFLPGEELAANATPDQVAAAYDRLPPDVQGQIDNELEHELGMKIEDTSQLRILAEADMAGSSTRPLIALRMSWVLIFEIVLFTIYLFYVVYKEGTGGLESLSELWMVFGILTATPVSVIMTYFNARTKEKRTRYAVAHGQSANLVSGIMGLFKK